MPSGTSVAFANRYRILGLLGEGAMGKVLRVHDELRDEAVALKLITGVTDKSSLQFRQEFRLMTQLRHPNCCTVHDYGLSGEGEPFFTMEIVPGQGLDELLPMSPEAFVPLFAQLMLALGYVHQQGLVHLDVKSANVRVRPDGSLKLMDFGLMEYAGQAGGAIRGTLPYISPEMARRAPVDQRSDLYSAGVLAYEMLSGRLPFQGSSPVAVLRAHLGEEPEAIQRLVPGLSPALARMVMRLLAKEPVARYASADEVLADLGHPVPAGLGGSLLRSPMVGREGEMALLEGALAALEAGQPGGVVVVHGPSGMGKSRLLDEFRVAVQLAHIPWARGHMAEHQRVPYAGLTELLRGLLPVMRQQVPEALGLAAPVLVPLLPELGVEAAPSMESPKHDMLRLQASVTALLKALASVQPVVAVLEGWQWVDEPTAEFFTHARRNLAEAPILWVLSCPLAHEDPWGKALPLAGLGLSALRRMVANMLGSEAVAEPFALAVATKSQENPLHVERLLEHLVKSGLLLRHQGRWNTDLDPDLVALPANLDALVAEALAALPSEALALARVVAVHERPIRLEALQALTGLDDAALFDALAHLQRGGWLLQDEDGLHHFAKAQDREVVYQGLAPQARGHLHGLLADQLLAELPPLPMEKLPAELVAALALHCLEGDRHEAAIAFNLEAGRRAVALFALADAESHLLLGLRLLESQSQVTHGPQHLAFLRLLGELKRQSGQALEALTWLAQALTSAEAQGQSEGQGSCLTAMAACHLMLAQYEEALNMAEQARSRCLAEGDLVGAARAARTSGRAHFFRSELPAAREAAAAAVAHAQASGAPGMLGLAYAFSGYLQVASEPAKVPEGVAQLNQAIALLSQVGDRVGLNDAHNLIGNAELMLGNPAQAQKAFEVSAQICRENGLGEEEAVALVNLATTAVELGAFGVARAQAAQSRALAVEMGAKLPWGMALAVEGLAAAYLGDLGPALALPQEALGLARGMGNRYLESAIFPPQLEGLVQLGRLEEAEALGEAWGQLMAETGNTEGLGSLCAWQAIALVQGGKATEAAAHLAKGRAVAAQTGSQSLALLLDLAEAQAALAREAWDEAKSLASVALPKAEALGLKCRQAELSALLGEVALATGDRAAKGHFQATADLAQEAPALRAEALFGLAASEAYAPEAQGLAQEAERLLRQIPEGLGEEAARAYFSLPARRRILEGNFLAFGLPRTRQKKAPTQPLGMGWGF